MKPISVFGLGYVGAVSAGCFADRGHTVIGVDTYQPKVDTINAGRSPIIEQDIGDIIASAVKNGRLSATTDTLETIKATDISMICVGTPSRANGSLELDYVRIVCEQIGAALRLINHFHVVVARSTMLPGTMQALVIPTLEKFSGKTAGRDFGVCNNPEFLRESTAVYDFYHPPKTVIGETDSDSGNIVASLYSDLPCPLIRTKIATAEMVKYTDNVWHALKVGFANEIGNLSKEVGVDGHDVMDIFCQDDKLNLSPYYLKPGFAFGGSCLPKDVRALTYKAKDLDLSVPILDAIIPSNTRQIERGLKLIMADGSKKKIGVLGFAFKAGTDDLRESPMVEVIERLIGKGYDLKLYDKNVTLASLVGANKDYILNHIPHIYRLMADSIDEILLHADTVVVGTHETDFEEILSKLTPSQNVVDLVRMRKLASATGYQGICW
ncbi:MAG: UDP-glucose/GDP-mannose dehydrogenase family protein [Gammaproteobacteria bacterium]|nr:UDP-glucose/GDP-mannose dehydrogenase family protein [Gammaproteobacteria bacterium]